MKILNVIFNRKDSVKLIIRRQKNVSNIAGIFTHRLNDKYKQGTNADQHKTRN